MQWGLAHDPGLKLGGTIPPQDNLGRRAVDAASLPLRTLRIDGLLRYSISNHALDTCSPPPEQFHSSRPDPSTGPEVHHQRNPGRRAVEHVSIVTHQTVHIPPGREIQLIPVQPFPLYPRPQALTARSHYLLLPLQRPEKTPSRGPAARRSLRGVHLALEYIFFFSTWRHHLPGTGNTDVQAWHCEKRGIPARRAQTAARLISFGLFLFDLIREGTLEWTAPRFVRVTNPVAEL